MSTPPQPPAGLRNLSLYAQVSLVMVAGVYLLWAIMGGVDSQIVLVLNPDLQTQVEAAAKAHQGSPQWVEEVLKIMGPRMHWPAVALATSLVAFPILGLLLGRFAEDPTWAGILPLVDLMSGLNPVMIGQHDLIPALALHDQMAILLVQIVTIHAAAQWAHGRKA